MWGVKVPIYIMTTKVDDRLVDNFDIHSRSGNIRNILFLSRITIEKGIFIAIQAYRKLQKLHPQLKLTIVGEGEALKEAQVFCFGSYGFWDSSHNTPGRRLGRFFRE